MTNKGASSSSSKSNNNSRPGLANTSRPPPSLSSFRIPKKQAAAASGSHGSSSSGHHQRPSTSTKPSENSRAKGIGGRPSTTTTSVGPRPLLPTTRTKHVIPGALKSLNLPTAHLPLDMETCPTTTITRSTIQQQQQSSVCNKNNTDITDVVQFNVGPRERVSIIPSSNSQGKNTPVSSDGIKRSLPQKIGVKRKSSADQPVSPHMVQGSPSYNNNKHPRVTTPTTTNKSPLPTSSPAEGSTSAAAFCPQQEAMPPSSFHSSSKRPPPPNSRHKSTSSKDLIKPVLPNSIAVPPPPPAASDHRIHPHHQRHGHQEPLKESASKFRRVSPSSLASNPSATQNNSAHLSSSETVPNRFMVDPVMSSPTPSPAGPSSRHRDSGRSPDNVNNTFLRQQQQQPFERSQNTFQKNNNNNSVHCPSRETESNKFSGVPMMSPLTRPPSVLHLPSQFRDSGRSSDGQNNKFSRQPPQQQQPLPAAQGSSQLVLNNNSLTPLQKRMQDMANRGIEELPATRLDAPSTRTWKTSSSTTSSSKMTVDGREKHSNKSHQNYGEVHRHKSIGDGSRSGETRNPNFRQRFPSGSNEHVATSSSVPSKNLPMDSSPKLSHRSPSSDLPFGSSSHSKNRQRHPSSSSTHLPPPPPSPSPSIRQESSYSMRSPDSACKNVKVGHPPPPLPPSRPPSPSSRRSPINQENYSQSSSQPRPGISRTNAEQNTSTNENNAHANLPPPLPTPTPSETEIVAPTIEQKIDTQDQQQDVIEVEESRRGLLNYVMGHQPPKIKASSSIVSEEPGSLGRPTPKEPQRAHYHTHSVDEEKKYVTELAAKNQHIKIMDNNRRQSSDVDKGKKISYLDEKIKVFDRYDFRRKIDPTISNLPAFKEKNRIIHSIEKHPVVIIDGYTGCGKSTQVPQLLIDRAFALKQPCNVLVTQPRRIAALSVARRVCEERGWEIGSVVGYQIGLDKKVTEDTLVTFMTTGVLLQKLRSQKTLKNWTHIIIDEVHERELDPDLLMLLMKKILLDDSNCHEKIKIILMSATLDCEKFCKYFIVDTGREVREAPVIKIPSIQRLYKIEELFLNDLVANVEFDKLVPLFDKGKPALNNELYSLAVNNIIKFDENEQGQHADPRVRQAAGRDGSPRVENRGSVLVFLPGMKEINQLEKRLDDHKNKCNWNIIRLHSDIKKEEQGRVFQKPQPFYRKIILATNIAESAITVPDVCYVIDFCLTKSNCVDGRTNFNTLQLNWCAISQCIQRKGRTGRVGDGKVYRLVPREFYKKLSAKPFPQMQRSNIEDVVLKIKAFDMGSPTELLSMALDPPDMSRIYMAIVNLKEVGALTNLTTVEDKGTGQKELQYKPEDGDLTFLGKIMSDLPISAKLTRLIALGYCFGVMDEAIIIAAGLTIKSPFVISSKNELDAYVAKMKLDGNAFSDCFTLLYAFKAWQERSGRTMNDHQMKHWARINFIHLQNMEEIQRQVDDIKDRLKANEYFLDYQPIKKGTDVGSQDKSKETAIMLKIAIAGAFYPNYFHRPRPNNIDEHMRNGAREVACRDILSTVYFQNYPIGKCVQLYSKQVADYLACPMAMGTLRPSVPFITIPKADRSNKGSKVCGTFESGTAGGIKVGGLCLGMYRALKRRQIRDNLEIQRIRHRGEEEIVYEQAVANRNKQRFTKCPPSIDLPSIREEMMRVIVTHAENPSEFWVTDSQYFRQLSEMPQIIKENLMQIPYPKSKLVNGALCLAPFQEKGREGVGEYYRARIDNLTSSDALVYFVDYGNSGWVPQLTLQDFAPGMEANWLTTAPCLALKCRLSHIKPATTYGPTWTKEAVDDFKSMTQNMQEEFDFKIYAVDKSVVIGELISRQSEPLNFKEYFTKKKGYGEERIEPDSAQGNRIDRDRFRDRMILDEQEIADCDEAQIGQYLPKNFLQIPHECPYKTEGVVLRGPLSPLELEFQSLCQSTRGMKAQVDHQSVNCVALDHDPTPTTRLLIAASINIVDNTQQVTPRETTMMPGILDIAALMSLIFAPAAELRTDRNYKRYTGALCGLGWDRKTGSSLYLGHDMDVIFETKIDDSDIHMINTIRTNLNCLLRPNNKAEMRTETHSQLRKTLFRLLTKKRERVEHEVGPREIYVWNQVDPSRVIPPSNDFTKQHLDTFLPHSTVQLSEKMEDDDDGLRWFGAV